MINESDSTLQKPARRRWGWPIFFIGWTLFVLLAVWWLWHRVGQPSIETSWLVGESTATGATLWDRLANWFKLADLNFHAIYPWILLAPYVAWIGWRFPWWRPQWRTSLPAHVAGCALFAILSHLVWVYADWWNTVHVKVFMETRREDEGVPGTIRKSVRTNEIVINAGHGGMASPLAKEPPGGVPGQWKYWTGPGEHRVYNQFFMRRGPVEHNPFDLLSLFFYASLVGSVHTVQLHYRSRERERRAEALEAQLTTARLSALQAQLHPHFLFNALNGISTLLVRDARAARDALASFSELLRIALCQSKQAEVTLREDMEFLRRYVEIQQTRLGDRLGFEEAIPSETLDCLVPALLLQPLVENAIRHGIEPSLKPGLVRVVVQPEAKRLKVVVEDNGAGLSSKQTENGEGIGISLKNLKARLETLYGAEHRLEVGPRLQGGVTVSVEIPLRRAPVGGPATAVQ